MHKTSAELADIVKGMKEEEPGAEALAHLMRQRNWTGGSLEMLRDVWHAAEVRLHVHGAPDWLQGWPHPPEPKQNWRGSPELKVVK